MFALGAKTQAMNDFVLGAGDHHVAIAAGMNCMPLQRRWQAVEKKIAFQRQACAELGLHNVQCVHDRVERWQGGVFDLIASRAFSALSEFVSDTAHLLAPQGRWFALKGAVPHEEIAALAPGVKVERAVPLAVPQLQQAARCVVVLRPQTVGPQSALPPTA